MSVPDPVESTLVLRGEFLRLATSLTAASNALAQLNGTLRQRLADLAESETLLRYHVRRLQQTAAGQR